VGDEPSCEIKRPGQHLAGDLGVDAFVPVGEAVVAEEGEDHEGGEEGGECGGGEALAAEGIWFVLRVGFRGHENSVRGAARTAIVGRVPEVGWREGAIDLAGETFGCGGVGAGVVAGALGDLLGGVCAAGGGDPGGAYVPDSRGAGEL
jgi:hypothetical protein